MQNSWLPSYFMHVTPICVLEVIYYVYCTFSVETLLVI